MATALALIPILAGGATTGGILSGISLLTTVGGGIAEYRSGKQQAALAENNARIEEINTRRELFQTDQDLLLRLSRNNVAAAASGLTSSGSVARAEERNRAKAAEELSIIRGSGAQTAGDLRQSGKLASDVGKIALGGSLFDAAKSGLKTYRKIRST